MSEFKLSSYDDTCEQVSNEGEIKVLPVSVIDIAAQKKRKNENHSTTSSRANYSPFPAEISDLCYQFYLRDATNVFDPFAGWGERHHKANEWGKAYTGIDISQDAINAARESYGVNNILADALDYDIPSFDGLITCPPYWNLEKYAGDLNLSRIKTWERFVGALNEVFEACYAAADPGAIFCVMVGDWRKNKIYHDLEYRVSGMFSDYGAEIVDKVVVSRKKVSKIKIMLPQAKRMGYSVRVHESLLVHKKPEKPL